MHVCLDGWHAAAGSFSRHTHVNAALAPLQSSTHASEMACRRWSFCAWTLAPTHHQVMCIEDTHEDARFSENKFVLGSPHIRFYCGTPLVASNGHRLGTL